MKDLKLRLIHNYSKLNIMQKRLVKSGAVIFSVVCLVYLLLAFYVTSFTFNQSAGKADTAIVLGAKSFKGSYYNPCLISRVKTAVITYQDKNIRRIIMSGGNDAEDGVNEAETMLKIAGEHGIPTQDILLEKHATSTYENLLYSKTIMAENDLKSAVIVTEPFHIARSVLIARTLEINATYLQAGDSPCWTRWRYLSKYFLKEPVAILYYVFTGRITLSAF